MCQEISGKINYRKCFRIPEGEGYHRVCLRNLNILNTLLDINTNLIITPIVAFFISLSVHGKSNTLTERNVDQIRKIRVKNNCSIRLNGKKEKKKNKGM